MTEPTRDRPRQVTLAGWLLMIGSGLVVVLVYQRVAGLHSLETQAAVDRFLSEPPGSDLGLSSDAVITLMRTLAMVTGGCAAAAAILGYQVLQRSRAARLVVTVLAVPLFFAGLVTGGFLTSVVAASATILWLQPARSWFDGTIAPERRTASASAPSASPVPPASSAPLAPMPPGAQPVAPSATPPPASDPAPRPRIVVLACVLTWVCTAATVVALIASAVVLAISPDEMLDQVHRDSPELAQQGISDDLLIAATYLLIAGVVIWCLSAAVLAVLVLRRVDWARIVLIVSAVTAAALCLLGTVMGAILLVLPLLASVLCAALLVRPEARQWFARRDAL
ncbi:hypothetical protein KM427_23545 [Nocardioides sp. LMS-CY]|uniref:hypothetical protein n=1 Tax=Nocardioides sp. (strain LMS-CY) TaxID=2840457 RepID=UPI001BFFF5E5|nr:hypothetical protein [Nocardioides sp. LMS-CY]QWF21853.1 hypothetical protein KM427_23545 [Nocardioides sp. LMS-CY]